MNKNNAQNHQLVLSVVVSKAVVNKCKTRNPQLVSVFANLNTLSQKCAILIASTDKRGLHDFKKIKKLKGENIL